MSTTATRKTVIHIVGSSMDSLIGGTTVARRIHDVQQSRGVSLEVFIFAGAQRALADPKREQFNKAVDELVAKEVPVSACLNFALSMGSADDLAKRGIQLEAAREAFIRFTMENATVITV